MVKRIKQILAVCGLTAAAITAAWLAAPTSAIAEGPKSTITVDVVFGAEQSNFTTTGGVLCPEGTASTVPGSFRQTGKPGTLTPTFHLEYTLTCDDGSGTFTIKLQAVARACEPTDIGGWVVVGGTGDYENLHGGGNLVGTYPDDPCAASGIIDVYTGVVMN